MPFTFPIILKLLSMEDRNLYVRNKVKYIPYIIPYTLWNQGYLTCSFFFSLQGYMDFRGQGEDKLLSQCWPKQGRGCSWLWPVWEHVTRGTAAPQASFPERALQGGLGVPTSHCTSSWGVSSPSSYWGSQGIMAGPCISCSRGNSTQICTIISADGSLFHGNWVEIASLILAQSSGATLLM